MSSASIASRPPAMSNSSFSKDSPDFGSQSRSQVQPAKEDDRATKPKMHTQPQPQHSESTSTPTSTSGSTSTPTSTSQSQATPQPQSKASESAPQESASRDKGDAPDPAKHDGEHGAEKKDSKNSNPDDKAADADAGAEGAEEGDKPAGGDGEYPEQMHAGKLDGVGPEYGKMNQVTMSDRIQGVKERIKGTIKRDPELKHKGHERMTGELKKKEKEESEENPFEKADEPPADQVKSDYDEDDKGDAKDDESAAKRRDEDEAKSKSGSTPQKDSKDSEEADEEIAAKQTEQGSTNVPHAHPTEKGREEQAASVRPEGEQQTDLEKKGQDKVAAGEPN